MSMIRIIRFSSSDQIIYYSRPYHTHFGNGLISIYGTCVCLYESLGCDDIYNWRPSINVDCHYDPVNDLCHIDYLISSPLYWLAPYYALVNKYTVHLCISNTACLSFNLNRADTQLQRP